MTGRNFPTPARGTGRLATLAWRLIPASVREDVRTELEIEYRDHIRPTRGPLAARLWYARQFVGSLVWQLRNRRSRQASHRNALLDSIGADTRFALRSFRRSPAFAGLAILTIALGIGASTVVFSTLEAVVLRPLPYPESHRLVHLWHDGVVSKAVMARMIERLPRLDPMAGVVVSLKTLTGPEVDPDELSGEEVTDGYWSLFGATAALGSLPRNAGTDPSREGVVVLSHEAWTQRFGARADILGERIRLGDESVTVVAVMSPGFEPLRRSTAFWMPMRVDPDNFSDYEGVGQVTLYGRLPEGLRPAAVAEEAQAAAQLERDEAPNAYSEEWVARAAPSYAREVLVEGTRAALWITMAAVLLVLLIACSNVANLLLARSTRRTHELALRLGLGAGRLRIIRQLLTESLLLSFAGAVLGVLFAFVVVRQFAAAWDGVLPRAHTIAMNPWILTFALVATLISALVFGLAPAVRASAVNPRSQLADGGGGAPSARSRALTSAIVIAELALSVVLVIAAGLMLRTVDALVAVDPGFRSEGVTSFRVRLPDNADAPPGSSPRALALDRVLDNLRTLPGVTSVGATSFLPMATGTPSAVYWLTEDGQPTETTPENANFQLVAGDYFETLDIPLIRGRGFAPADRTSEIVVGIINEAMARTALPGRDPIGARITMFGGTELEVVGVVADVRQRSPERPPDPEVYFLLHQAPFWGTTFVAVASDGEPPSADVLRSSVWEAEPSMPVLSMRSMHEVVTRAFGRTRLFTGALLAFGALQRSVHAVHHGFVHRRWLCRACAEREHKDRNNGRGAKHQIRYRCQTRSRACRLRE